MVFFFSFCNIFSFFFFLLFFLQEISNDTNDPMRLIRRAQSILKKKNSYQFLILFFYNFFTFLFLFCGMILFTRANGIIWFSFSFLFSFFFFFKKFLMIPMIHHIPM